MRAIERPNIRAVMDHYGIRILREGDGWTEEWRPVVGRPGYEVSDLGRVRNTRTGCIQNPKPYPHGYVVVKFNGKHRERLHRVVLRAFVGEPPEGFEGSHLNGIRTDNRLSNLAWEDHLTNNRRRHEHGTQPRGEGVWHLAKLTEESVRQMRRDREAGVYLKDLAERYGVNIRTVSDVVKRRTWRHVA